MDLGSSFPITREKSFYSTSGRPGVVRAKIEIPSFIEFEKTYNNRGFAALGIALDEGGWKAVKPFVTKKGMNYPVVVGNDSVAELYGGIDSLPTTFLIDRDGGIASTHVGLVSKSEYQAEIVHLIAS
jgi:peroxiredoxin